MDLRNQFLSNCLFYAVGRYLREGGSIIVLHSLWGWWPHFVWTADMQTFWEFYPARVVRRPRRCPPTLFWGSGRRVTSYDIAKALIRSDQKHNR